MKIGNVSSRRQLFGCAFAVLAVLWIAFILTRSMKPADASAEESGWLLTLLQTVFPDMTDHFVRKLAHFTEFFLLGALTGASFALLRKPAILWPLGICALIAATDETVQLFFEGRSCEFKDALLDTLGSLCALVLLWLLLRRGKKTEKA